MSIRHNYLRWEHSDFMAVTFPGTVRQTVYVQTK